MLLKWRENQKKRVRKQKTTIKMGERIIRMCESITRISNKVSLTGLKRKRRNFCGLMRVKLFFLGQKAADVFCDDPKNSEFRPQWRHEAS